jgi:hypothetical protein
MLLEAKPYRPPMSGMPASKGDPEMPQDTVCINKVAENQRERYLGDQVCYLNNHITTDALQLIGV